MKKPTLYICGPMTGIPDDNTPAFKAAARQLTAAGFPVLNPADHPKPACGGTWEGWMRLAIAAMARADALALLPGWQQSRGALLEFRLAHELTMHAAPVEVWLEHAAYMAARSAERELLDSFNLCGTVAQTALEP